MAEQEMQDAPEMMSLNDALALMHASAAAGGSAKIGPALLARLVEHIDGLQVERDELTHDHHQVRADAQSRVDAAVLRVLAAERERDTARGAVRELERKVFGQDQALNVLRACVDRHQRDAADPPGYLQDAVIRAAGLGALHTERDAAIKERDELRALLAELDRQEPVAFRERITGRLAAKGDEHRDRYPMVYAPLYARPVPAVPDESLNCDVCGVACEDPWHYSAGDQRHLHACDACWPGVSPAGYADGATPDTPDPYAEIAQLQRALDAERSRCAAICRDEADKCAAAADRSEEDEPDEVDALKATAWKLIVAQARIEKGEPA